jgi:para-nitrobenzyl esterase
MIVTTAQGRLEGFERNGAWQFRGIPYAAAPVGERRFRPPAPPEPWDGIRPAREFGAVSWQGTGGAALFLGDEGREPSEDCLHLNVVTPACDDGARPVMVWIHGGGFVNGSASTPWYDGTRLALRGDVVVVGVNYRLGALGFLWLGDLDPELRSSGVNGLLDQAAALRWVQENIAAFGGDPGNVTVFGESAGAMSISTLLAMPAAGGLFHRAIAQSGAAHNCFSPDVAAEMTSTVMSHLGVTDLDGVLAAEPEALVQAGSRLTAALFADIRRVAGPTGIALAMGFEPVVDGRWLPQHPLDALRCGTASTVPLLVGTNRDEWNLFRLMSPSALDHPELLDRLDRTFGDGHRIHDTYLAARPGAGADELWSAVLTDASFRIPAERLLEARAEGLVATGRARSAPGAWEYLFSWPSPAFGGIAGSCHALEIPFVFGVLDNRGAELVLGGAANDELWALSAAVQDAWLAFARHGSPGHAGLPDWPRWTPGERAVMRLDLDREVLLDPAADRRTLWEGLV